jgi:hypothetical protein
LIVAFVAALLLAAPIATYVGGSRKDGAASVAVARDGTAYIASSFSSFDFLGHKRSGADWMAYVARVSAAGEVLSWRSLGGSFQTFAFAVAVDNAGDVVVAGSTASDDFPTAGTLTQHRFGGARSSLGSGDAFAVKLRPNLWQLRWSTYIGAEPDESAQTVLVGTDDDVWLGGWSDSRGFIARLDGRSGKQKQKQEVREPVRAMSWDRGRQRIVIAAGAGESGRVMYLDGTTKLIANFLPKAIAVDSKDKVWVAGKGRVIRVAPTLGRVEFTTSLGGEFVVNGLSACQDGKVAAVGAVHSAGLRVTADALQTKKYDNDTAFVTIFDSSRVLYSTLLGSGLTTPPIAVNMRNQRAFGVVCADRIFITGATDDLLLGIGQKAGGTDGFLLQLPRRTP